MRTRTALVAAFAIALLAPAAAQAAPVPPGATWTQANIPSAGGVSLHADILRPKNLPANAKTPVVLSIGPYFNHSGQVGPAGPVEDASYDPVGPTQGPSDRFYDFVNGAKLMQRGYTFVMVDLRGFGGSSGCLDWGGPGEQADVVSSVNWLASRSWSNGRVGMYGKSYDGVTGLVGVNKRPGGLKAVVAQEPVYDLYRYLYGDGIRRLNSAATPALYNLINLTPGPALGNPLYSVNGADDLIRPGCNVQNQLDQTADDDHGSAYWLPRNLIPGAAGSKVPLFLTQGPTENNTVPDGLAQYMRNHAGYQRSWLGPWEHVRGAETCKENDISTGCSSSNIGRLKMGRAGFYDEVIRFYDRFLKGAKTTPDPQHALQTNDGIWRAEADWPPSDSRGLNSPFRTGSYTDDADGSATGTDIAGVWTISKPLPHAAHLAGSGRATVNVSSAVPNSNVVVDVYDLDAKGTGPLVTRQGHLIRQSGTIGMDLWSMDWKFAKGHRIAVRVTDANSDWWVHTAAGQSVDLTGGNFTLPWLRYTRPGRIAGNPGVQLAEYLKETITVPQSLIASSTSASFKIPPKQINSPRFGIRAGFGRHKYGRSRNGKSFLVHCRASGVGRRRCSITARWKRSRRKVVTIGRGARTIPAGRRSILVRVKLNKTGRRLLKRRPRGTRIRLNLRVRDSIGQIATNTRRVRLRLKR